MWNAADGVEDSPRSGEEEGGWIPSLGYSGKEGVTFLFVRIVGMAAAAAAAWGRVEQGPSGSFTPIITFTAAAGGLSGRTRV